ncbi:hypothetical protein HMPREF9372_1375 [Sporosarcina newyorkensis 2681]|uniref:Uncharacterized protein n=1 Tax=Sporosarcina newyorkensis 2681 TaxID=1027292 RepID=F9DRE5_9BACL|nr:hypothetical protein HMPREF9372_1375 [Sporosarcina newyorkensis 2681]
MLNYSFLHREEGRSVDWSGRQPEFAAPRGKLPLGMEINGFYVLL